MRRESLPDGGHDKVIWKRSRDRSRDKKLRQCNSETSWRHTTATLLGVSFGSYRRRCRDVLMGRLGYVTLRRLGDVSLRRRWVFHLRRPGDVLMECCHYVPLRRRHGIPIRRLGDVPLRRSCVFHLRRTCDVATLPRRLVSGWVNVFINIIHIIWVFDKSFIII